MAGRQLALVNDNVEMTDTEVTDDKPAFQKAFKAVFAPAEDDPPDLFAFPMKMLETLKDEKEKEEMKCILKWRYTCDLFGGDDYKAILDREDKGTRADREILMTETRKKIAFFHNVCMDAFEKFPNDESGIKAQMTLDCFPNEGTLPIDVLQRSEKFVDALYSYGLFRLRAAFASPSVTANSPLRTPSPSSDLQRANNDLEQVDELLKMKRILEAQARVNTGSSSGMDTNESLDFLGTNESVVSTGPDAVEVSTTWDEENPSKYYSHVLDYETPSEGQRFLKQLKDKVRNHHRLMNGKDEDIEENKEKLRDFQSKHSKRKYCSTLGFVFFIPLISSNDCFLF